MKAECPAWMILEEVGDKREMKKWVAAREVLVSDLPSQPLLRPFAHPGQTVYTTKESFPLRKGHEGKNYMDENVDPTY